MFILPPATNEEVNIVQLSNPRAIVSQGKLYLKTGAADFVCCPLDPALAIFQHQVNALCAVAHRDLEMHPTKAEAFIQRLLAKAPTPADEAGAVAVVPDRATGTIALGFQYDNLMPIAVRLSALRAVEIAARITTAYPQLMN